MRRVKSPEDLTIDELRHLLVEKRRKLREQRLERFRRSGRVVTVASEVPASNLEPLYSTSDADLAPLEVPKPSPVRRVWDGLLLLVEITAVVGLVFILFNGLEIMRNLNTEFAQALEQPRSLPLRSSLRWCCLRGIPRPTLLAAPCPTRRKSRAPAPTGADPRRNSHPDPGPEQAIRIQIPAINVDAPIVQGDGWEQLKKGVGQNIGSANPGQPSNMILTAHNDVFGEIFRDLDLLKPGDQIIVHTAQRAYTYLVTGSEVVEPTRVEVMAPTTQPVVTLISCYPYLVDNKRIVVKAQLQSPK